MLPCKFKLQKKALSDSYSVYKLNSLQTIKTSLQTEPREGLKGSPDLEIHGWQNLNIKLVLKSAHSTCTACHQRITARPNLTSKSECLTQL